MIQGGGFDAKMNEKRKGVRAAIKNESGNGLSNVRGTIAMARTPDPNSATSQFFINLKDNDFLDQRPATPSSARSSTGWTWSTRSRRSDDGGRRRTCTRMCRSSRSSSRSARRKAKSYLLRSPFDRRWKLDRPGAASKMANIRRATSPARGFRSASDFVTFISGQTQGVANGSHRR